LRHFLKTKFTIFTHYINSTTEDEKLKKISFFAKQLLYIHILEKRANKCWENCSETRKKTFPEKPHVTQAINKNTVKVSYSCMPNIETITEPKARDTQL